MVTCIPKDAATVSIGRYQVIHTPQGQHADVGKCFLYCVSHLVQLQTVLGYPWDKVPEAEMANHTHPFLHVLI